MSQLKLTPIGTSPAWYNPGDVASGYVIDADGFRILLDCGSGVFARYLTEFGADYPIDAVVISHAHADHVLDLVPFAYGMHYGGLNWKPQLWLPPGALARLNTLVSSWSSEENFFEAVFDVRDYSPGSVHAVGPCELRALEVPHFIESFALRFEHARGSLGYSSDMGASPEVAPFMQNVDLFLCEAALAEPGVGHLCGQQAGEIAQQARAKSLLLTHIPDAVGTVEAIRQARTAYNGPVAAAQPLAGYSIAAHLARVG